MAISANQGNVKAKFSFRKAIPHDSLAINNGGTGKSIKEYGANAEKRYE